MSALENVREWFTAEGARNKLSAISAGALIKNRSLNTRKVAPDLRDPWAATALNLWLMILGILLNPVSIFSDWVVAFFAGWWFLIDTLACYPGALGAGQIIVGIVGTISFFMVNTVKNSHLSEDNYPGGRVRLAKIWLMVGFMLGFSSIIAAIWIMVEDFSSKEKIETWPGVAMLIQNVLILISNLIYRFGRHDDDWSY